MKPKFKFNPEDLNEVTKDFLPVHVAMDSFLCWMAIARFIIQKALAGVHANPLIELNVGVSPLHCSEGISMTYNWCARWMAADGAVLQCSGGIAIELLLQLLQPDCIQLAHDLQAGLLEIDKAGNIVTLTMMAQTAMKKWPHKIDSEVQMLASYTYNQASTTMNKIESKHLQDLTVGTFQNKAQA